MFSRLKEEKVVKPPQKPVARKKRQDFDKGCGFSVRPQRKPIRRHPAIFTSNVPSGNDQ
jgi:hypothetical protein